MPILLLPVLSKSASKTDRRIVVAVNVYERECLKPVGGTALVPVELLSQRLESQSPCSHRRCC